MSRSLVVFYKESYNEVLQLQRISCLCSEG